MGDRYKVLIVEDEVLVRGGLKSVIGWEKLGMEIIGDAANGKQALEIYEADKPDIILTDIKNAGDGWPGTDREDTRKG